MGFDLGGRRAALAAREVICVNYVCGEASEASGPLLMSALRVKEGLELTALFRLRIRLDDMLQQARWR